MRLSEMCNRIFQGLRTSSPRSCSRESRSAAVVVFARTRLSEPRIHVQEVCGDDYDHHTRGIEPLIAARVDSVHDFAYFRREHAKAAVRLVIYRSSPTSSS